MTKPTITMRSAEPTILVDFDLDHDGRYHRVQVDGSDLVSIEDNGDGTAHVTVYASSAEVATPVWSGVVRIDGHLQLVTCDNCEETSEAGWGDTALCLDCEDPANICKTHNRTFVDECPICRADEELIREQP